MIARAFLAGAARPTIHSVRPGRARFCQAAHTMDEKTIILSDGIRNHKRDCLARAITLIESSNKQHRVQAKLLLESIAYDRNALDPNVKPTVRLGIAGPPGRLPLLALGI